jgi:hypothetical protein
MRPPGLLSWAAAIALFGGILGVLFGKRRVRRLCAAVAVLGLVGTVYDLYARSQRPARPDLVIRLINPPPTTTSPMLVRVCGRTREGAAESPTAGGRFLLVRVDGVQVGEIHGSTLVVPVGLGRHMLRVEITSQDHQEFQPALVVDRVIHVTGAGSSPAPTCPST